MTPDSIRSQAMALYAGGNGKTIEELCTIFQLSQYAVKYAVDYNGCRTRSRQIQAERRASQRKQMKAAKERGAAPLLRNFVHNVERRIEGYRPASRRPRKILIDPALRRPIYEAWMRGEIPREEMIMRISAL